MIRENDTIMVGKFQKTHALKGELNMISDIDAEYFNEGNALIVEYDGILVPYYTESVRPKGSTSYLVKLSGVDNEREASQFVNKEIHILKKDAEEWIGEDLLDSNELVGYMIKDFETGEEIGQLEDIEDSTANLLFIVKKGEEEIYIPGNEELIEEIDDNTRTITVRIPEGLIDLNSRKEK